jgi:hypothetical protein
MMKRILLKEYKNTDLYHLYINTCRHSLIKSYLQHEQSETFKNVCRKFLESTEILMDLTLYNNSRNDLIYDKDDINRRFSDILSCKNKPSSLYYQSMNIGVSPCVIYNSDNKSEIYAIYDFDLNSFHGCMFGISYLILNEMTDIDKLFELIRINGAFHNLILHIQNPLSQLTEFISNKINGNFLGPQNFVIYSHNRLTNQLYYDDRSTYVSFERKITQFNDQVLYKYTFERPIITQNNIISLKTSYNGKFYSVDVNLNDFHKDIPSICTLDGRKYYIIYHLHKSFVINSPEDTFKTYIEKLCNPESWLLIPSYDETIMNTTRISKDMFLCILSFCNVKTALNLRLVDKRFKLLVEDNYPLTLRIRKGDMTLAQNIKQKFQKISFEIHDGHDITDEDLKRLEKVTHLHTTHGNVVSNVGTMFLEPYLKYLKHSRSMSFENSDELSIVPTLSKLKILDLNGYFECTGIHPSIMSFLTLDNSKLMANLEELYLSESSQLGEKIDIRCLGNMICLKKLCLESYEISGNTDEPLNLKSLQLNIENDLTPLNILLNCQNLEELIFVGNMVNFEYLNKVKEFLVCMPKLRHFKCRTMKLAAEELNNMKEMRFLDILMIHDIENVTIMENLTGLFLVNANNIKDLGKFKDIRKFPKLEYVCIGDLTIWHGLDN